MHECSEGADLGTGLPVLVVVVVVVVATLPRWPHSRNWGYFPTSMRGVVVIALLVMVLMGKI
ncbi:DUF3309 domain-containing protein [Paraburkholderia saeva]|uniref:DUF3309 domain-containing protein n=1 Tax=Paraburkholderia saeva TaxID=2777537 RepID=UPI00226C3AC6|nr:DUF3309 domain-containing protein [Paraburkholderia saeva]